MTKPRKTSTTITCAAMEERGSHAYELRAHRWSNQCVECGEWEDLPPKPQQDWGLYPNLEALSDGRIGAGTKVGEYPLLRHEAKGAIRELKNYAALVERCRNDRTRGCWCGVHTTPVQGNDA